MHKSFKAGLAAVAAGLVASSMLVAGNSAGAATAAPTSQRACSAPQAPGYASCHSLVRTDASGNALVSRAAAGPNAIAGYHPADIQKAYGLATAAAAKTGTVAIVDAYHNPNAEKDLGVYRSAFGLPPCTKANGCFKQVNQNGATSPMPPTNTGWGLEISLDVDMVSAVCPKCKIVLVEANSNSFTNLGIAAQKASSLAHIVSHSYGANEFSSAGTYQHYYTKPGVIHTVSSGDFGFAAGPQVPADFPNVVAVGGTKLTKASNARGFNEAVWSKAGSGCSGLFSKPAWQKDPTCKRRSIADVSAVADPATGVSVYDTFGYGGWLVVGGTSASAPIIAGVYALAGHAAAGGQSNAKYLYAHAAGNLYDVTTGNNGSCGATYYCTGKAGYDMPTGLGTPKGVGAF